MIVYFLAFIAISWLILSLTAYLYIKKTFKGYKDYPRIEVPQITEPAVRRDFGKWDEQQIIKGCFLRFPFHIVSLMSFLTVYMILVTLHKFLFIPNGFILFYRSFFGKLAIRICFNIVEYDIKERITTPIIISNHVNWMDFVYMGTFLQPASIVSKKEVQNVLIFNRLAEYVRALYVDRSSPEARHKLKAEIAERVQQYKENPLTTYPIIIYPEGTVTNGRSIISFKNGAFEPLCPITVFSLKYECKQFHMGLDEVSSLEHVFIVMALKPTLRVRQTIITPEQNQTVEQYRQRCRGKLAELSGFKLYNSDYKDILNYDKKMREVIKEWRKGR